MGFEMKVLWQDHTFVIKCTVNALCLMFPYFRCSCWLIVCSFKWDFLLVNDGNHQDGPLPFSEIKKC